MNRPHSITTRGFTLLEILLVVAIISILAGIVIVAINPAHQLAMARDAQRRSDIKAIYSATQQYLIDHGSFPASASSATYVCPSNAASSGITCTSYIDLMSLVPTYLSSIPNDPQATSTSGDGYRIIASPPYLYVDAPFTEVSSTTISIGKAPPDSTPAPSGLTATGFGDISYNGTYILTGSFGGKNYYEKDSSHFLIWRSNFGLWNLTSIVADFAPQLYTRSNESPVGAWTQGSGDPGPGTISGTYP